MWGFSEHACQKSNAIFTELRSSHGINEVICSSILLQFKVRTWSARGHLEVMKDMRGLAPLRDQATTHRTYKKYVGPGREGKHLRILYILVFEGVCLTTVILTPGA